MLFSFFGPGWAYGEYFCLAGDSAKWMLFAMPNAMPKRRRLLLRISEAAADLDVTPRHVRELIRRGDLEGYRLDRGVSHVSASSIRAWLKARRADPTRRPEALDLAAA